MNPSTTQDVSLYDCALSAIAPPHPLQVSQDTLKGSIGALMDLLIEQKIPATLWIRLPQWWEWPAQIERYREWVGSSDPLYIFKSGPETEAEFSTPGDLERSHPEQISGPPYRHRVSPDEPPASRDITRTRRQKNRRQREERQKPEKSLCGIEDNSLISDEGEFLVPAKTPSPVCEIQLAAHSKLQQEYFLLVLSAKFCAMILAHQPRSVFPEEGDEEHYPRASHRKRPLLSLYSFDPQTIQLVLDGLKPAVSLGRCLRFQSDNESEAIATHGAAVCESLLDTWDARFGSVTVPPPDPVLLGHLLSKQIQHQEQQLHHESRDEELEVLQQQNEELLDTLRFKDEFLNKIGQELRMPLTNMKTALSLLDSPKLKPAQRARYSALLHQSCERQNSLIDGFLELVRLQSEIDLTRMQEIHLADLVPGIVTTYQPLAQEKGLVLAYTLRSNLPPILGATEWLKKILINLLHNAIKFTPAGGEVWVRAKQQGDYVQLDVRDTGVGVPASEIPKIFEAFYRGRQAINEDMEGAGLGLTVVQQLLLHSGGSIAVKSRVGRGSIFKVLLPIYEDTDPLWPEDEE